MTAPVIFATRLTENAINGKRFYRESRAENCFCLSVPWNAAKHLAPTGEAGRYRPIRCPQVHSYHHPPAPQPPLPQGNPSHRGLGQKLSQPLPVGSCVNVSSRLSRCASSHNDNRFLYRLDLSTSQTPASFPGSDHQSLLAHSRRISIPQACSSPGVLLRRVNPSREAFSFPPSQSSQPSSWNSWASEIRDAACKPSVPKTTHLSRTPLRQPGSRPLPKLWG